MATKLLIAGIPGMGKTTVGNELQNRKNFKHINLEDQATISSISNVSNFIAELRNDSSDIVVTWGFVPDENQTSIVLAFKENGFHLIWLDGNRGAAREAFVNRNTVPEELFDVQLGRIENTAIINRIKPILYNTFDKQGNFKSIDQIIKEILALVS